MWGLPDLRLRPTRPKYTEDLPKASLRVRTQIGEQPAFANYLALLKINGQWKIINKIFYAEPKKDTKGTGRN